MPLRRIASSENRRGEFPAGAASARRLPLGGGEALKKGRMVLLDVRLLLPGDQEPLDRLPRLRGEIFLFAQALPRPRAEERKERSPDIPFGGDDLEDPEEPLPPFFLEGKKGRKQLEELPVGITFGQGAGDRQGGFRIGTPRFVLRGGDPFHEKAEKILSPHRRERLEGEPEPPEHAPQNVGRDEPGRAPGGGR